MQDPKWLARLDAMPGASTEADVTRVCAAAEQFAQDLARSLGHGQGPSEPAARAELRNGADRVSCLAALWRFATDSPVPPAWTSSAVEYWREVVRSQ